MPSFRDERARVAQEFFEQQKQTNKKISQEKILEYANCLNQLKALHIAYATCDSLSISYSTLRYFCSLLTNNSTDKDALVLSTLTSKEGLACFVSASAILMAIAILGATSDKDATAIQKACDTHWSYVRAALKAAKNAYKAGKNTLKISHLLGSSNLSHLTTPLGLLIGAFHILNCLYIRRVGDNRKAWMAANQELRQEIYDQEPPITPEDYDEYLSKVKRQSSQDKFKSMAAATASGLVNGLYYQMGILTVTALTPALLIPLTVLCGVLFIFNLTAQIYQEHKYQEKLERTALELELTLEAKRLAQAIQQLNCALKSISTQEHYSYNQFKAIQSEFLATQARYEDLKKQFNEINHFGYREALLKGINEGAYAYSAISSLFFSVSLVMMLCATAIPPLAVLTIVVSGFVAIAGFIINNTRQAYNNHQQAQADDLDEVQAVKTTLDTLRGQLARQNARIDATQHAEMEARQIQEQILGHLDKTLDDTPQPSSQELFEVIRSLFSGLSKGEKPFDAYYSPDDSTQTTLAWSTLAVSFIYGAVYSLRAYAKSFSQYFKEDANNERKAEAPTPPSPQPSPASRRRNSCFATPSTFFKKPNHHPSLKRRNSIPSLYSLS